MGRASGPAALASKANTDPLGDVDDERADLTRVGVSYTERQITLRATIPGGTDPATDPLWQSTFGYTSLMFAIDVGDIGYPEFIATLMGGPQGTILATLSTEFFFDPTSGEGGCGGVTGAYSAPVYTITVPSDCLVNPPAVRVTAGMVIYSNVNLPFPIENPPVVDVAPDREPITVQGPPGGYVLVSDTGSAFAFGGYGFQGSIGPIGLARPIVDVAATRDARGYTMLGEDGGIFTFGTAVFRGSAAGRAPGDAFVAITATPSGRGYWVVSARGRLFAFGDATIAGPSNGLSSVVGGSPIVDLVATPSGDGYWAVAADGSVYSFGDARFFGSAFGLPLRQPIVTIAPTASGRGYWLIAADGGVFSYGDARFLGSTGDLTLVSPITDIDVTASGNGYTLFAEDGGVFGFGDARFFGSASQYFGRGRIVAAASI
jgi:hypothetical protein